MNVTEYCQERYKNGMERREKGRRDEKKKRKRVVR
jgi:hypothetical protein